MAKPTPEMLHEASGHQYEFVPGTHIREPLFGRVDDYRPWEAPPTDRMADNPEVHEHQGHVADMHAGLFELIPHTLSPEAEEFTRHHVLPGEGTPGDQTHYEARLLLLPDVELSTEEFEEYEALESKVAVGRASMAEITRHAILAKRRTAELSMLRTVGPYRTEYEKPMFREAYGILHDKFRKGPRRKVAVTGFDNHFFRDEPIDALSFGFKQHLGTRPDGLEVAARYNFAVDVNPENGFNPAIRDAIQQIAQEQSWAHVPQLSRPNALFQEIMKTGPSHPRVIAAVIKLYLFSRSVDAELKQRAEAVRKQGEHRRLFGESAVDSTKLLYKLEDPDNDNPFHKSNKK